MQRLFVLSLALPLLLCLTPNLGQAEAANAPSAPPRVLVRQPIPISSLPAVQKTLVARGPISPPFPDVPKDHWAYQAVETLRKAGVIVGYPSR